MRFDRDLCCVRVARAQATHDSAAETSKEPVAFEIAEELARRAAKSGEPSKIRVPKLYPRQIFPKEEAQESMPAEIPEKLVTEFQESVDYNKSFLAKLQERQNELEKDMEELGLSDDGRRRPHGLMGRPAGPPRQLSACSHSLMHATRSHPVSPPVRPGAGTRAGGGGF